VAAKAAPSLPTTQGKNELSSAVEGASGTVVIEHASCGSDPAIEMTVDARLGSELFGEPGVRVEGALSLGD